MHWGRGYRKLVASLALFGLTVQLAFSLGHFHFKDIAGEVQPSTGIAETPESPRPVDPDPQHEDEYCAIYAFSALIGSARSAEPSVLLFPQPLIGERLSACRAFHIAKPAHVISQARAPPMV